MKLKQTFLTSLLAIPALLAVSSAQATPVTGQANIAGNVTVSATSILFAPTTTNTPGAMETGDFAGYTAGTIKSLTGGPATGSTNVSQFAVFSTGVATPISFDLNFIAPGTGTLAACGSSMVGASCTPAGSPFTLFQLSSNTIVVSLQLNGVSYTGTPATGTSPTTSIFTTQLVVPGTIPEVIALLTSGQSVNSTYSASFVATAPSTVPEPASMMLMGIGLVGAGLIARRRFAK